VTEAVNQLEDLKDMETSEVFRENWKIACNGKKGIDFIGKKHLKAFIQNSGLLDKIKGECDDDSMFEELYKEVDEDGDGLISKAEFHKMLSAYFHHVSRLKV
jgi:hypothetical protein